MTIFTPSGRSVWNNKQGWTCEALPALSSDETAVVIQLKNGILQSEMKERLKTIGLGSEIYYLGKNDPKLPRESNLVYLAKICHSYSELLETVGTLQSASIPVNAVSVITPHLQKLTIFTQFEQRQTAQ